MISAKRWKCSDKDMWAATNCMWHPDKNVLYGLGSLLWGNRKFFFFFLTICIEIILDLQQSCKPLSKHFHITSNLHWPRLRVSQWAHKTQCLRVAGKDHIHYEDLVVCDTFRLCVLNSIYNTFKLPSSILFQSSLFICYPLPSLVEFI